MNPFSSVNKVSWKYVISANLVLLLGAATVASLKPVSETTYNLPKAASHLPEPLTKIVIDSAHPPKLINPDIGWAKVGDEVVVRGENLGTKPFGVVRIGQVIVPANNVVEWQPNYVMILVPEGAMTAPISITVPNEKGKEVVLTTSNSLEIKDKNPKI
jgi:hypothetical protein